MSVFQFYTFYGSELPATGNKLVLDEAAGFDADFCNRYSEGTTINLILPLNANSNWLRQTIYSSKVTFQDEDCLYVTIESETSPETLFNELPVVNNYNPTARVTEAQHYWDWIYFNQLTPPDYRQPGFHCNLPAAALFNKARNIGELTENQYLNSSNLLKIKWMPTGQAFRILHLSAIKEWYHIIYDIFDADSFIRLYRQYHAQSATPRQQDFWMHLLGETVD
jgi:hypothetical protein